MNKRCMNIILSCIIGIFLLYRYVIIRYIVVVIISPMMLWEVFIVGGSFAGISAPNKKIKIYGLRLISHKENLNSGSK